MTEPTAVDDSALAELVRRFTDAIVIADTEGAIVFWNPAAEVLFGWPAGEAIGQPLDLIIPERLRDRHWEGFRRVMATGESDYGTRLLEVPALTRDGHPLSIGFTITLLHHPDGSIRGIAAAIRDETERWQQRRALRAELESLRNAAADQTTST
jgi:PAS domain S-box-containing protein